VDFRETREFPDMSRTLRIEDLQGHEDFLSLRNLPWLQLDLRYASKENFVGADMYSPFDCAWLHRDAVAALENVAELLATRGDLLTLRVLDALRPQRVQERMWEALKGTGLTDYLAHPVRGSIHSFGMAVDVTLADAQGRELDMGTPFDDLTERSHPALEDRHLANGELTRTHIANRAILRDVMSRSGWQGISREWWHFDAGDRERVRAQYVRVL
jgi:D-alanyl-D-alanine dipeptidase